MATRKTKVLHLAEKQGVETQYTDELGHFKTISQQNLRSILKLLNNLANKDDRTRHELDDVAHSSWQSFTPPTLVVRDGSLPPVWHIHLPVSKSALSDMQVTWSVRGESGGMREHRALPGDLKVDGSKTIQGRRYTRVALPFPQDLQLGYYEFQVKVQCHGQHCQGTTRIIVAPQHCYLPPTWRQNGRTKPRTRVDKWWGLTVQLYGLRSRRNWGIGDFRDLATLLRWGKRLGAAMVGVNPLHALPPGGISPYSPSSRLFHNPLYLDLEWIAEFKDPRVQRLVTRRAFQRTLESLRQSENVNYEAVWGVKWPLLQKLFRIFTTMHLGPGTGRGRAFRRFMAEQGQPLQRFALFQALQEHVTPRGVPRRSWREWPNEYQHPDSPSVQRFLRSHQCRVNFYGYLEWQCDEQLKKVQSAARRASMPIGLYTDFAIGIDPHGADAWAFQDDFAKGASVGAPPDLFSPKGQNWGLTPPHPDRIADSGYRLFVEAFRRNMRHSGLFRLDHAMGLFRLFWIPEGRSAAEGAYVKYPAQDLLGILALESRRHHAIVVGEDLGTVTPDIRAHLMQAGLLSYRLLFFEKSDAGTFLPPHHYPQQAMTAVTTHDLPTLRGFWTGRDIVLKEELGLYPDDTLIERDKGMRHRDRQALLTALRNARVLPRHHYPEGSTIHEQDKMLCRAVYTYLARTPCYLLAVPLEDLLGDLDTPNLPGAPGDQYPVWRMKAGPAGSTIDTWSRLPRPRMLAQVLSRERPIRQCKEARKQLAS
jgi:4-alpha-glucanotransferase